LIAGWRRVGIIALVGGAVSLAAALLCRLRIMGSARTERERSNGEEDDGKKAAESSHKNEANV
jgi:hypothetical protein